jgi:hypothetical protein
VSGVAVGGCRELLNGRSTPSSSPGVGRGLCNIGYMECKSARGPPDQPAPLEAREPRVPVGAAKRGQLCDRHAAIGDLDRLTGLDPVEQGGGSETPRVGRAYAALDDLATRWTEVPPSDAARDDARRLVRVHDLRAADAFQLAAARIASDGEPRTLPFVTLDERLALAASREGFPVLGLD